MGSNMLRISDSVVEVGTFRMKSMALGVHVEDVWGAKLEGAGGAEE